VPEEPTSIDQPASVTTATAEERLAEGWERVRLGDYKGGVIMAKQALQSEEQVLTEEATYLLGFSLEWDKMPAQAITHYDVIIQQEPRGTHYHDALFRKTESLGKLGEYHQALALLKEHFEKNKSLSDADQQKVALLKAIWLLEQGKERAGIRGIKLTLERMDADSLTWYQAQARSALVRRALQEIRELELIGSGRKMLKILTEQATLVTLAEEQLNETLSLKESHWILTQIHDIGDCYQQLGVHLLNAPGSQILDDNNQVTYPAQIRQRVENVFVKAIKYYDLGLEHAHRVQWSNDKVFTLQESREDLMLRLENL
jgi:tetratricopeptide (TPR) repeat protein